MGGDKLMITGPLADDLGAQIASTVAHGEDSTRFIVNRDRSTVSGADRPWDPMTGQCASSVRPDKAGAPSGRPLE